MAEKVKYLCVEAFNEIIKQILKKVLTNPKIVLYYI